jgi:hypothetical protein
MSLQTRLADLITALGADEKRRHGVVTAATTATLTLTATSEQFNITAQASALVINPPAVLGDLLDGQSVLIRIKDNGTARAISWDSIFRALGVTLPLTTVIGKTLYVGAKWNSADSKYDVIAVGQEV